MHALTGLALAAAGGSLPPRAMSLLMIALPALAVALEITRHLNPSLQAGLVRLSAGAMRPAEIRGVTGGTVLALGLAAAWFLFPPAIATRAIAVTATADPAASAVGTLLSPPGRKTMAGSLGCFVVAFAVLALWHTAPVTAAVAAIAVTLVERIPGRALDNLAVPLAAGAVLLALG